jgi:hypothetical protein
MKNPFSRKKPEEVDEDAAAELEAEELQRSTEEIEAEKERKRLLREEKKFHKLQAKKRKRLERFLAPIFLGLTIVISLIIYFIRR